MENGSSCVTLNKKHNANIFVTSAVSVRRPLLFFLLHCCQEIGQRAQQRQARVAPSPLSYVRTLLRVVRLCECALLLTREALTPMQVCGCGTAVWPCSA